MNEGKFKIFAQFHVLCNAVFTYTSRPVEMLLTDFSGRSSVECEGLKDILKKNRFEHLVRLSEVRSVQILHYNEKISGFFGRPCFGHTLVKVARLVKFGM